MLAGACLSLCKSSYVHFHGAHHAAHARIANGCREGGLLTPSSTSMRQTQVDTREHSHSVHCLHAMSCIVFLQALTQFLRALADAIIALDAVNPIVASSVAGRFSVVSCLAVV